MDKFILKVLGFITFAILGLAWLGSKDNGKPLDIKPWLPPIVQPADMAGAKTRIVKFSEHDFADAPWAADLKDDTEAWADFLEELDNLGISPWDPDAEDIWETYK